MASNNTLFTFAPQDNEPTATDFATPDTANNVVVLDYDASTSERGVFKVFVPRHYSNGGITITHDVEPSTATTGSVVLRGEVDRISATGTISADSFGSQVAVTATMDGNVARLVIAFTATQLDSLASSGGEWLRYKLTRVATATGDDMSGDMEFIAGEGRET